MYGFIYVTTNNINGKKYIGQKKYVKGWEGYLGSGIYLKRAINKYGKSNFTREILEECENKEQLDAKEIYWINFFDAVNNENFYNIASGGEGGNTILGYSEEEKKNLSLQLSIARKGIVNIGSKNGNARRIICLNTMEIFESIVEAAIYYNIDKDAIQQCCSKKSKRKTAGIINGEKAIWEYYDENTKYEYIPFVREFEYINEVYCINTNELFINATVAGNTYNINSSSISQCCNNKLLSAGKHPITKEPLVWCYKKDIDFADEKLEKSINNHKNNHEKCKKSHYKKLKCINTGQVFESIKSAMSWCGGNPDNFSRTLKEDGMFHYKKHPETGEKLKWVYV